MRTVRWMTVLALVLAGCEMGRESPAMDSPAGNVQGGLGSVGADAAPLPAAAPVEESARRGRAGPPQAGGFSGKVASASSQTASLRLQQLAGGQQAIASSMIIRTGYATVEVDTLEPAIATVQALALSVGGYVANIGMQTGRTQLRQATLELKVPADRFTQAVEGLDPIGRLESMNVTAEDVGEEFTDVTARVANARRLEERLLNLLATRTGRLEDILAAERELARVREEIERYEGRLRYLRSRTALSTLHVTVHEPAPIIARAGRNPILEAFRGAWRNFVGFVAALIELMGILIPLGAIVGLIVVAWIRWGPRWNGRREGGEAGVSA